MKRNEHIVPLSRDHHFGLLLCWKIRQGVKRNIPPARIQKYVCHFWDTQLHTHFEEEETFLFSQVNDKLCDRAFDEHKEIEARIAAIRDHPSVEALLALAGCIDGHIRFEERELFPFLESRIPAEKLAVIGQQLEHSHSVPPADHYGDEFWA